MTGFGTSLRKYSAVEEISLRRYPAVAVEKSILMKRFPAMEKSILMKRFPAMEKSILMKRFGQCRRVFT